MTTPNHRLWPGKTFGAPEGGPYWHPATFHCLDVAAVATTVLSDNHSMLKRIAEKIDATPLELQTLCIQLVALHDIGKLTQEFCQQLKHTLPVEVNGKASTTGHWQASYELLIGPLDEKTATLTGVASKNARKQLYAAVAGHHGRPPAPPERAFKDLSGVEDCKQFIEELSALLGIGNGLTLDVTQAKNLSWFLSGLTVISDWLGSNTRWFNFTEPTMATDEYWQLALNKARTAIFESGLTLSPLAPKANLQSLFGIQDPRPMQKTVASAPLSENPTLAIIEDSTGSGKTESALMLAWRMMDQGLGEGVYVALPTMATAGAMYQRMSKSYRNLFASDTDPSLALAHGRRMLNDSFVDSISRDRLKKSTLIDNPPTNAATGDESVESFCSQWIADNKKKTFLAQVGVGTIDQALMSILPIKYSSLRRYGLASRILIVDEVHACDPYMEEELLRLLEMQGMLGGSAILMSATLTNNLVDKLVNSYRAGLGCIENHLIKQMPYPSLMLASVDKSNCQSIAVEPCPAVTRTVPVERVDSIESAVDIVVSAHNDNTSVVWIRNTVNDAIEAYEMLVSQNIPAILFTARFALQDRMDIEKKVLSLFGADAIATERTSFVLIATQVVEASLDLDFDVMITDLAPIDSLIQRAGRLWRHMTQRPPHARGNSKLKLHVLSADPNEVESQNWSAEQIGNSGFVYGIALLWRSAAVLFDTGEIKSPDGLRPLLEGAIGETCKTAPECLENAEMEWLGQQAAERQLARANVISPSGGYLASTAPFSDSSYPTRVGPETVQVVLVHKINGVLELWAPDDESTQLSQLSLNRNLYDHIVKHCNEPLDGIFPEFTQGWAQWRLDELRLLEIAENGHVGSAAHYNANTGLSIVS